MVNPAKAKEEFNQRLDNLQKEMLPAHYGHNLKEMVIYGKLLEMHEQINKLVEKIEKKEIV